MNDVVYELRDTEIYLLLQASIRPDAKIPGAQLAKLRPLIPDLGHCERTLQHYGLAHCWRVGSGFKGPNREPHLRLTEAGLSLVRAIVLAARELTEPPKAP